MKGNIFSEREFEIIKLVNEGLDSEHIAEKLFLSKHTVNTHRKNILDKSGLCLYCTPQRGKIDQVIESLRLVQNLKCDLGIDAEFSDFIIRH